ncbi:MAG: hypothetical protein AAF557_05395 [Pseudomonadota bacterium]
MAFQLIHDSPVAVHDRTNSTARFLTPEETIEMARIQKDDSVIGYALLSMDGEEIESSGAWKSVLGPVFANIFDLVENFGEEFGERQKCPMVLLDGKEFEIAGVLLSSARAIFLRRKEKGPNNVLRRVS